MPTGKITFPGGLSHQAIQVPKLPGSSRGVKGSQISTGGGVNAPYAQPTLIPSYGTGLTDYYAGIVPEIAKANYFVPSNQGHRALKASEFSRMADVHNSPSRSQMMEGYTEAIQQFNATNTYNTPNGQTSVGTRARQPSTKFVSPFSNLPIPTSMPWDL